jgi:hypothetical protein
MKVIVSAMWPFARSRRLRKKRRVAVPSRAAKTTAPTVAPTITLMGLVVEDESEELLGEAAGRGVVISNLIFAT